MSDRLFALQQEVARITFHLAHNMPPSHREDLAAYRRRLRQELHKLYIERKTKP